MQTYALIDNASGYLWGITQAKDALSACQDIDADNQEYNRTYTITPTLASSDTGYHVYSIPEHLLLWPLLDADGQDSAAIALIERHEKTATIKTEES